MNDQPDDGPPPGPATEKRLVTRHHRVRRTLGAGFFLSSLLVIGGLVVVTAGTEQASVERTLVASVDKRLKARGLGKVEVAAEGRSIVARVPAGTDEGRVLRAVAGVEGVVEVRARPAFDSADDRRTCGSLDRALNRATNGQRIPFAGTSTQLTTQGQELVVAAAGVLKQCPEGDIVVGGHTDDDTSDAGALTLQRARVMTALLEQAGVDPGRLEPRGYGDQFPLREANTPAARQANERGSIQVRGV